jgi:hypothetical protein
MELYTDAIARNAYYAQLLAIHPAHVYSSYAGLLYQRREYVAALQNINKAITLDHGNALYRENKARILREISTL